MFPFLAITQADQPSVTARCRSIRRHLLRRTTTLAAIAIVTIVSQLIYAAHGIAESRRHPNIVFIMADDKCYLLTDRYGDLQKYSLVLGRFRRVGMSDSESDYR